LFTKTHVYHGGSGLGEGEEGGGQEAGSAREEETAQGLLEIGGTGVQGWRGLVVGRGLGLVWLVGVRGKEREDEER